MMVRINKSRIDNHPGRINYMISCFLFCANVGDHTTFHQQVDIRQHTVLVVTCYKILYVF